MSRGARLLVVGWDGATWDLARRFMAEGRMPVLQALCRQGAHGPLRSTLPPITLPAWSSFLCGVDPGKHGVFDFTHRVPGQYRLSFVDARQRQLPSFLRLLSDQGARVASIALPGTYPPERLNGLVVGGFDSPVALAIDASHCQPPALWMELRRRFGGLRFADFQELRIGPGWHEAALASLLREIGRKEEVCGWLLRQERWDVLATVFGESDTAGHHFWMFCDPASPRFADQPALATALGQVYGRLDAALGLLLERARPELLCLLSDHGMGGAGTLALYLNRFLESRGWLRYRRDPYSGTAGRAGTGLADAARALALRHLPAGLQQGLVRKLPKGLLEGIESSSRYADIDFSRTRAFSDEMSYAATIHLNLAGRDRQGVLRDSRSAAEELSKLLLDWRVDGLPVVSRVHRRSALYRGPWVERSVDMVLELALREGYSSTLLPSGRVPAGTTWRHLRRQEHLGGRGLGMNGSHRRKGVLLLHGSAVAPGELGRAALRDVAPSLMGALGHGAASWMDGRSLLAPQQQENTPASATPCPAALSPREDPALLQRRLRRLGYL